MALLTSIAGRRRPWAALDRWAACLLGLAVLGLSAAEAPLPAKPSAEYQLKAVFLFNFAQFVEWPAGTFSGNDTPLVIGVLGEDPFGAYLDGLVQGEKIGERSLLVRRSRRADELTDCHILFISRSEAGQLDKIIAQLKNRRALTVGDSDDFNRQGGMVRLATENGKIQLRINVAAAKAAELTISSKLLAHATIVSPGKD